MKKILLFLIFILIPSACYADWSQEDTIRELMFLQTMVVDWKQTLVISEHPGHMENNPILGKKPHRDNVNIYFAGCAIGHAFIAYCLPEKYRDVWQLAWIGIQSNQIDENNDSGLEQNIGMEYQFKYSILF